MGKVEFSHEKILNRNRVRKHRHKKYLQKIHNEKINERIKQLDIDFDESNKSEQEAKKFDDADEFKDKLRIWVLNHRLSRAAVNDLLMILISIGFSSLPKDSRTLMATPVKVPIEILTNGKLWYNGIRKCIEHVLARVQRDMTITLDFNIDGVPISKSSSEQFWPILSAIQGTFKNKKLLFEIKCS